MTEMSKTFEGFQLVLNFVLFLTLALFFSIHEKYKLAKIWGGLQSSISPRFYRPESHGTEHKFQIAKYVNFLLNVKVIWWI